MKFPYPHSLGTLVGVTSGASGPHSRTHRGAHSSKGECATAVSGDTIKCAPQCLRAGSAHLLHMHNCPTNDHACKGLHVSLRVC